MEQILIERTDNIHLSPETMNLMLGLEDDLGKAE